MAAVPVVRVMSAQALPAAVGAVEAITQEAAVAVPLQVMPVVVAVAVDLVT